MGDADEWNRNKVTDLKIQTTRMKQISQSVRTVKGRTGKETLENEDRNSKMHRRMSPSK